MLNGMRNVLWMAFVVIYYVWSTTVHIPYPACEILIDIVDMYKN